MATFLLPIMDIRIFRPENLHQNPRLDSCKGAALILVSSLSDKFNRETARDYAAVLIMAIEDLCNQRRGFCICEIVLLLCIPFLKIEELQRILRKDDYINV